MAYESKKLGPVEVALVPSGDNYIYFVSWDDGSAVIDPAVAGPVLQEIQRVGHSLSFILATHKHIDHVGGIAELKDVTGATVIGPTGAGIPRVDREVQEGDMVEVGPLRLEVWATPGHTKTCISYVSRDPAVVWCGDTLFAGGCGRLFECGPDEMWNSLHRLAQLPESTLVYCGHEYTETNLSFAAALEPSNHAVRERLNAVRRLREAGRATIPSTIGEEKRSNPFLRAEDPRLASTVGLSGHSPAEVFAEIRHRKDHF